MRALLAALLLTALFTAGRRRDRSLRGRDDRAKADAGVRTAGEDLALSAGPKPLSIRLLIHFLRRGLDQESRAGMTPLKPLSL